MSKVKVLFFAADPSSTEPGGGAPRLRLDEDVRRIREKVRAAEHRDALEFDFRLAATPDDLIQALNETRPRVVHFSGHGGSEGLVLVGPGGKPVVVGTEALAQLFEVLRGGIRVVVLNACFSLPQAEAIAASAGCAVVGTRDAISDEAAMTFGASFYRAIAFGHPVRAAFDQARAALALQHFEERDCPVLVAGAGVDPATIVLVRPDVRVPAPAPAATALGPDTIATSPGSRPALPGRRGWLLAAFVWLASTIGAIALAENARHALVLGMVPLLIAAALLRFLRSAAGSGGARSAAATALALALAAGSVLVGADLPGIRLPLEKSVGMSIGTDRAAPDTASDTGEPRPAPLPPSPADTGTDGSPEESGSIRVPVPPEAPPSTAPYPSSVESDLATARHLYQEKHYAEAVSILERTAAAGNPEAMGYLGVLYLRGWGTEKKPGRAIDLLRQGAALGDARSMNALGVAYQQNEGLPRDYEKAMHWFQMAQEKGYAEAMNNIGGMYRRGWGTTEPNDSMALHWYRRAAGAGSLDAMVNAGLMYALGRGTTRDMDEAVRLYGQAVEAGSSRAMVHLGSLYREGDGVPRDYAKARSLFLQAANAGSPDGMNNLGVLYNNGLGMRRDLAQAIYWFRRAAVAGSAEAAGNLAGLGAG